MFCSILYVRSKSLVTLILTLTLAHTQGEGITHGHKYQEVGIIGAILEAAYPKLQGVRAPRSKAQSWRGLEPQNGA